MMSNPREPVSVDQHLADVLDQIRALEPVEQPLLDALGLPIAQTLRASLSLPAFDNSAMDGYAVVAADIVDASEGSPVRLPVAGDILAGDSGRHSIEPGTTMRIMTGAPMPAGGDAVVPVEWTDAGATEVLIDRPAEVGAHLRYVGEDIREGDVVLEAGTVLGPRQVANLAGVGIDLVSTAPRPRVVVMSTGEEIVEPGRPLPAGSIYDANSYLLAAAVRATGAIAYRAHATSDDPDDFRAALDDELGRADLVITSGGVSKGTRDVVKAALRDEPGMTFREVAMQPGKPQGFGVVGPDRIPLFALPGNPVSSYVSFELFVAPALRKLVGRTPYSRPMTRAELTEPVTSLPARRQFLRGVYADGRVRLAGGAGSHLLSGLGTANALIVLGEEQVGVAAGESVQVLILDQDY